MLSSKQTNQYAWFFVPNKIKSLLKKALEKTFCLSFTEKLQYIHTFVCSKNGMCHAIDFIACNPKYFKLRLSSTCDVRNYLMHGHGGLLWFPCQYSSDSHAYLFVTAVQ